MGLAPILAGHDSRYAAYITRNWLKDAHFTLTNTLTEYRANTYTIPQNGGLYETRTR